jgi:hypothetical protein
MKSKLKADNEWWEGPSPGADFSADVSFGSKGEILAASKCFPLFSQQRTFCIRRRHVGDGKP